MQNVPRETFLTLVSSVPSNTEVMFLMGDSSKLNVLKNSDEFDWCTIKEAAHLLSLSPRTVSRRIKTGELVSTLHGNVRYVRLDRPAKGLELEARLTQSMLLSRFRRELESLEERVAELEDWRKSRTGLRWFLGRGRKKT